MRHRKKLASGKPYEAFFFAPGQCSLIRSGHIDGEAVEKLIRSYHPDIPIIYIEDVSQAIPTLAKALSIDSATIPSAQIQPLTQDWPFVD